jgi:hypothetical protein
VGTCLSLKACLPMVEGQGLMACLHGVMQDERSRGSMGGGRRARAGEQGNDYFGLNRLGFDETLRRTKEAWGGRQDHHRTGVSFPCVQGCWYAVCARLRRPVIVVCPWQPPASRPCRASDGALSCKPTAAGRRG